jgi:hypothetical protein
MMLMEKALRRQREYAVLYCMIPIAFRAFGVSGVSIWLA